MSFFVAFGLLSVALTHVATLGVRAVLRPRFLAQPVVVGAYLACAYHLLPASYGALAPFRPTRVLALLVLQDALMYVMHRAAHALRLPFHLHHHRVSHPTREDAFDASPLDTLWSVVAPLHVASRLVAASASEYAVFGCVWSWHLVHLHSGTAHPKALVALGVGTPAEHRAHHVLRRAHYGHVFAWWDRALGTYEKVRTRNTCVTPCVSTVT